MTSGSVASAPTGRDHTAATEDISTSQAWVQALLETEAEDSRRLLLHALQALPESDAASRLAALKEESRRLLNVDPHQALVLAEALVAGAELVTLPSHRALGLMAKGDALRMLGHYPESLALLDEAGDSFLAHGDELGWARTRIGWLISAHRLGRAREALAVVERAREILTRQEEWLLAGGLDLNTAVVCQYLGLYERALELYERARRAYESAGDAAGARAVWATGNRAILLSLLGRFDESLALHQDALEAFRRHGETVHVLMEQQNIAFVHAGQGDHTRALRLLEDALATATRSDLDQHAACVMLDMVECYLSLNRHQDASALAQAAAEIYDRIGAPVDAARARYFVAQALAQLGDSDRALELLNDTAIVFADTGLNRECGLVALQRALLDQAVGRWAESLEAASGALALFEDLKVAVPQARAQIALARAHLALAHTGEAAELAQRALGVTRERGLLWLAHEGHHVLGGVADRRGDLPTALESYETAIRAIEQTQTRLATELRSAFLEDKLQIYEDAIDCCLRLDEPRRAFEYLERAKSRALVDYLIATPEVRLRAPSAGDQDLVDELARLRREHNWFSERLHGTDLDVRADAPRPHELEALQAGLAAREKQIAHVLERLALRRAEVQGLPAVPTGALAPTTASLPSLGAGTVLLEYFFGQARSTVFVVHDGKVTAVPLETSARAIRRLHDRLQLNFAGAAAALASGQPLEPLHANARGVLHELYR
ncbi:MAG TPA: tetratricopeptide repeat protein, partial [Chloroflexota bacterium]|nr:tetratricopeptide repeat protein [Chloroflexota bacterium]